MFRPLASTNLAVGTTSGRANLPAVATNVRVMADGNKCYVRFGDETVEATTADMLIGPNQPELFRIGAATHVAAITSSGTAVLSITAGDGR
jgi:hypothetical protein